MGREVIYIRGIPTTSQPTAELSSAAEEWAYSPFLTSSNRPPSMLSTLKKYIPASAKHQLRRASKKMRYLGRRRFCPICQNHASNFDTYEVVPRPEATCPFCGSQERHRLIWLFFQRRTNLLMGPSKSMLHVAPEPFFADIFKEANQIEYLSADLIASNAMVKMDVTDIRYPDDSFDVIYCSHVLEHVPDDQKAMSEFLRVLKPSGWAVLQVPITADATFEDPTITDPLEREKVFGQKDHVRRYGPDYVDRLTGVGFNVQRIRATEIASGSEIESMVIDKDENVFYCTKP